MMLKIILFGYSQKVYSRRGIKQLTRESIPTMWLAAMQQPDYRTINEFRGKRMKSMMDELYETLTLKLIEGNYITMGPHSACIFLKRILDEGQVVLNDYLKQ